MPGHAGSVFPARHFGNAARQSQSGTDERRARHRGPMTGNEPLDHPLPAKPAIGVKKGPGAHMREAPKAPIPGPSPCITAASHAWAMPLKVLPNFNRYASLSQTGRGDNGFEQQN
jgi:hypothetical protein